MLKVWWVWGVRGNLWGLGSRVVSDVGLEVLEFSVRVWRLRTEVGSVMPSFHTGFMVWGS